MSNRAFNALSLPAMALVLFGPAVAAGAEFDACNVLSDGEWHAILGTAFYGPTSETLPAKGGAVTTCTYNFTELLIRNPTDVTDAGALEARLRSYLQDLAAADAEQGNDWAIAFEDIEPIGVPAVAARIYGDDQGSMSGMELYYVCALIAASEPIEIRVKSAESMAEARAVAAAVAGNLR